MITDKAMSYQLLDLDGVVVICCLLCGSTTANPNDVSMRYCARCHLFHDAVQAQRRLHLDGGTHDCGEWHTKRDLCAICGESL